MSPRVTVLVPVYAGADVVGGAIESVLAQTYEDFELLLIDDCSPDDSVAVIESFDDPRIRLIRNDDNLGQIGTLNRGLGEARGEYVARLDQDDRCLPARLALQVAILDTEPAVALVGGWMTIVDEHGHRMGSLEGEMTDYVDFVFDAITNQLKLGHPAVTFRRDAVLELGGYDESIRLAEDKDLWRRLALAGHEARVVTEPLVIYLHHPGQQSQQGAALQQESNGRALERFIAALSERVATRPVRLLLAWDDRFWTEWPAGAHARDTATALEHLIEDAGTRLRFRPDQLAKLDRLVRSRVLLAARRSWRSGVLVHWRTSPALLCFALRGSGRSSQAAAALGHAVVYLTAPLLNLLYRAKQRAMSAIGTPTRLRRIKQLGKRSPRLVSAYSRLRGGR